MDMRNKQELLAAVRLRVLEFHTGLDVINGRFYLMFVCYNFALHG